MVRVLPWACAALALLVGCTAAQQRRAADRDAYRIVRQAEADVFGRTNAFGIDTPYSNRRPEDIKPGELIADRLRTGDRMLTMDDALKLAVDNSRRFQAEKERLYLTALTLTGARHALSPNLFGSSRGSLNRGSDGKRSGSLSSQIGVDQLLATGGSLGVTLANDLFRYYSGDPQRSVMSTVSVNLLQPLLRGFGKNNAAVETVTQSERNVVYALRNYAQFQDQFALEIVGDYFGLLAQKDTIRNRYTNYLGRVQSTKRLEARAADRERLSDVDQARQAELTAKNNYVDSLAGYRNGLDQLKIKLGLPLGEKVSLDDGALDEIGRTGLVPVPLIPTEAYGLAVKRQLPVLNAIDQFEDSKRKVRLSADRLKADVNLFADASLASDGPTDYTKFDPDKIRAGVGVQLNLPFDRLNERNSYRATLIAFESQIRSLTLTLDSLRDDIERGLRTVEQRRQNYEIQKNALELANRRVLSTELLLQAGRAEVRDLVEAQDAQIAAQNAVTTAMVAHQESRLQLMLDIGALDVTQPRFWLKDHLAKYLPHGLPATVAKESNGKPVPPPDQFFQE